MATAWKFVAYYALPMPIILMVLLNIPAPRWFRKGVLQFTHQVFGMPLVGPFRLLHVMLFLTGMALLSTLRVLHNLKSQEMVWPTANAEITFLSKRWRAERNSNLAAFAFTMWCVLAAFYREAVRRLKLEERLDALEKERAAGEEARAARPVRNEPAVPREVPEKEKPAASSSRASTGAGERIVAQPPAAPEEPAIAGVQMTELKKEL